MDASERGGRCSGLVRLLHDRIDQLTAEFGQCPLAADTLIDCLYDYARELRQQPKQGLYLGTVHLAKRLEFRHVVVLDGGWSTQPDTLSDERRLYYVGITRAEQTLTLCEFPGGNPFARNLIEEVTGRTFPGEFMPELEKRYLQLAQGNRPGFCWASATELSVPQSTCKP